MNGYQDDKNPNLSTYDIYGGDDVYKATLTITQPYEFTLSIQETDTNGNPIDQGHNCASATYQAQGRTR